jgi:dephospho-CoA kinase
VLDADRVGHTLLEQRPARDLVLERFGPEIQGVPEVGATGPNDVAEGAAEPEIKPDSVPTIDRAKLGAIVFSDPGARRALERILHPRMRGTFEKAIGRAARQRRVPLVVLDAAVLFEAGWDELCDMVAFVDAPDDARRARLAATRGWSAADLAAREAAQLPLDTKRGRADLVISNGGTPQALEAQIAKLWSGRLRLGSAGSRRTGARPGPRPHSKSARSPDAPDLNPPTPDIATPQP